MQIKVLNNQSLLDIAIQVTGTANNAVTIARTNNIPTSQQLKESEIITVPDDLVKDEVIQAYYKKYSIHPATALTTDELNAIKGCEGIGCWAIDINFKVS